MRVVMIDAAAFARAVAERVSDFATIDQLVEIADEADVWEQMLFDDGIKALKKAIIRKLMRRNVRDEDGNRIEWVNVIQHDRKRKTKQVQVYKQLAFFNAGDFEQVIRDRKKRVDESQAELKRFCRLAVAKFGPRFQRRFDFDLPLDG